MNSIIGFSNIALEEDDPDAIREYLEYIRTSGHALVGIINQILDLSKLESGKFRLVETDYSPKKLFDELSEVIVPQALEKGITFTADIKNELPKSLHGDKIRLRQIVLNLLGNAVKYTQEGGVSMEIRSLDNSENAVMLEIHIKDSGIGIKEEDLKTIFDSFERVDETKNKQVEGTGLGLAIAKSLTNLMGGELTVKSVYGEGSDFCVYVPQKKSEAGKLVVEEAEDKSAKSADKEHSAENGDEISTTRHFITSDLHILIVDDNPVNLTVEKILMEKYGMTVDTAESGGECLGMLKSKSYDIIFMDHMMPEMDGVETMQHIREEGLCDDVPIVVVTANAIVGVEDEMRKLGFDGYVSKPIDMKMLEKEIVRLIPEEKIHMFGAKTSVETEDEFREVLRDYGIDMEKGLEYSRNVNTYVEVLNVALKDIPVKVDKLERYSTDKDTGNYTILVHSIRSSCAKIGAMYVSEQAKKMELAGRENDMQYIEAKAERFHKEYARLKTGIEKALLRMKGGE
jgi:CheY-like chemotaxis protein